MKGPCPSPTRRIHRASTLGEESVTASAPAAGAARTLRDAGEFRFIDSVARRFGAVPHGVVGIGDDAALLPAHAGTETVLSVDLLVDGTHFDLSYFRPEEVGARALSANLSDLAAMGAAPAGHLVGVGVPPSFPLRDLEKLYVGMDAVARYASSPLLGGDTVRAERLTLSVTVVGRVTRGKAMRRIGAREGDRLFVTGHPGWSALGFRLLSSEGRPSRFAGGMGEAARAHLTPTARWREAMTLGASGTVSAAIDLSDGLLPDLGHLLEHDGMGAFVDESLLSPSPRFLAVASRLGVDPLSAFLAGGEDYELLVAVRPSKVAAFARVAKMFACGVRPVGVVTASGGVVVRRTDGSFLAGEELPRPFDHFPAVPAPKRPRASRR